ncbi:hypothetical protein SPRG_06890 [Saprolegnia parasitica CBS 223.65]|uniref:Uncharacterized protein n=1 Tax=Saprolegnia parasitica (strain CBS 223.65) TaxID=695850 RepID=A0A067CEL4_SAPPC|nr:hypothetical protein SPRG_06890 [Saprolegnia parasitica CBS 223.65]KDO27620.1 hypothetical protein SPRG_06890 [Saprolegnia parasitica CBS 223.65]|eukprot:XP_012201742.1 hypothetical protein SPRG_06890 [Saprolegnia parasitica CBS 223.65]
MLLEAPTPTTPTVVGDGAVAHDDMIFLILHYLESTGLFAATVALLLESGLDHRWLCGPSRAMAQLRVYLLRGEFALALALLEPLQTQAPTSYARVRDHICAHAFLEACADAAPIPSRLVWLQSLTKAHAEYRLFETLAFATTPTVHPTLALWNTAQRRLQCYAEILADVRELPDDNDGVARYIAMPPMQLRTLVGQALRYQARESNQDDTPLDCLRPDAMPLPVPTQHLLHLASTSSVDDKKTTAVTASMVLPPKRPWTTTAPQNNVACQTTSSLVRASDVGLQTSVAVDTMGVQTTVVVATLGVQTLATPLASALVQTHSIDCSTTSAQTEPRTEDASSHFGIQTDVAEIAHTESQTPPTSTQDVGHQTALRTLSTDAEVQTTMSTTLCDAFMQTTALSPSAPSVIPLVLPTPTAEPTLLHHPPPPASTDFIRLSMTAPPPVAPTTLGRRNDMVRLSDGLAHLSRQTGALPQAPPTLPKPKSPVFLSTTSFSTHRSSVPTERSAKPSAYDQVPSPATAVVVAETREAQAVRALQVSHHGKYLLVGTNARAVRVLNVRDALAGPRDAVAGAALALLPVTIHGCSE